MTRPLPELLAEIDALLAKASAGEWFTHYEVVLTTGIEPPFPAVCGAVGDLNGQANVDLIVKLHNAYPQLRETAQDRERMREALEAIAAFAPGNGDVCEIIARKARAALARKEL